MRWLLADDIESVPVSVPKPSIGGSMRILAGCLLVAASTAFVAQSSDELHAKYGQSDLERFQVRPGIGLTVQYGSDRQACQIVIGPLQPLIHQEGQSQFISSESVSEILEEVAPVAARGKQIIDGSFQSSCAVGTVTDYENVTISRGTSACRAASPDRDSGVQIIFKRDICPKVKNPFGVVQPNAE
jgi:hypothetical protein